MKLRNIAAIASILLFTNAGAQTKQEQIEKDQISKLEEISLSDPLYKGFFYELADKKLTDGDTTGTIELYLKASKAFTEIPDLVKIANKLCELKRYEEATKLFEKVAEKDPTSTNYNRLAEIKLEKGDTEGAIENLETAIRLDPDNKNTRWYLKRLKPEAGKNLIKETERQKRIRKSRERNLDLEHTIPQTIKNSFDENLKKDLSKIIDETVNSSTSIGYVLLKIENPESAKWSYGLLKLQLIENIMEYVNKNIHKPIKDYKEEDILDVFKEIDYSIKTELGIYYKKDARFLNQSFQTGKANCLAMSTLYLSVGDALGFPIRIVVIPEHAFVRWDEDGKHMPIDSSLIFNNKELDWESSFEDVNWECTGGFREADKEFIKKHKIKIDNPEKELQSLNTRESIIQILEQMATEYISHREPETKRMGVYNAILVLEPNSYFALNNKISILLKNKKYQESISFLERLLAIKPNSEGDIYSLGTARYKTGDTTGSVYEFEKVLELNPRNEDALFNLAGLKKCKKEYSQAIELYNRLTEIKPKYAGAYYDKGIAKCEIGDTTGAVQDLEKVLEINPEHKGALLNLGGIKVNKKEYKEAIKLYNDLIKIDPNSSIAYHNRGVAKQRLEDHKGAEKDFEKAKRLRN